VLSSHTLSGCGGGEATRWISAENKIVTVEDVPYQVSWVAARQGLTCAAFA
jgi:hypothetical protein